MIWTFDEKKRMLYVANALSNKSFIRRNMKEIAEWICDEGQRFFEYKLLPEYGSCSEDEFMAFYKKNQLKAIKRIVEYAQVLRKTFAISAKAKRSYVENNLLFLQQLFNFDDEEREFLDFMIRMEEDECLSDILNGIRARCRLTIADKALFSGINKNKVYKICAKNSYLASLGLIDIEDNGNVETNGLGRMFYQQKFKGVDEIKNYILGNSLKARLKWEDFSHIGGIDIVKKLLVSALKNKQKGINILLYGEPGTGKSEFAKTLAKESGGQLYSIGENAATCLAERYDDSRFNQIIRANVVLQHDKNTCLLIDEADDVLTACYQSDFFHYKQDESVSKIKVNRLLENNNKPTIWISNNIRFMDKAYLRRFTYAINFTRPTQPVIETMWRKSLKENQLPADEITAKKFATKYSLSPSFIASAVKSAKLISGGLQEVEDTLDVLQEAYNNGKKTTQEIGLKKTPFNPLFLNTDVNLKTLAERIVGLNKMNFSMCLYGASGTGKSAFAQYLGEKLGCQVIKKRCSDLLSKWVGETEENIAAAFAEASSKQALLIFDEADSFLQDRTCASQSWEVTQVNEMLTQMEKHQYPFVCTTNLMDKLDKASLRRFTFKVKYDYMTDEQRSLCFEHFFAMKNVDLSAYPSLTPGDFTVVKDKAEILGVMNNRDELIKMLEQEQLNKAPVSRKIGFI